MKVLKFRKPSDSKADDKAAKIADKKLKIGRFFNPLVRILQYMILVLVTGNVLVYSVVYLIPMTGSMIAGMVPNLTEMDMLMSIMFWVMPYLFVSAFLFVGELAFIKWFNKLLKKHATNLIDTYRTKRLAFFDEFAKKSK